MSYEKNKWGYSKEDFKSFVKKLFNSELQTPKGYKLQITIDNDAIVASFHPGWDEDGEELGDPIYIGKWWPNHVIFTALNMLGLPAEHV